MGYEMLLEGFEGFCFSFYVGEAFCFGLLAHHSFFKLFCEKEKFILRNFGIIMSEKLEIFNEGTLTF